ncbi:MAG: protein kinase [Acidobacteriota bacterium]|nr:protein kinase [Acidobacteriota bacterium]
MSERKIGRYIIKGLLGEGAMGSVFKGHDPNLERLVAIKTMRTGNMKNKSDYDEFKERFFLEARANGRLNHPNIVSVYDSGLMDDEPYLVMEFIKGEALDAFFDKHFIDRLKWYIPILEQIAAGLDYAHEEGVIHRDVKPGNILVIPKNKGKRARVKILDFGLAKLKDSKLTATGYFLGTPSYSSPEQVMGGKLDIHSDLFSFGTVAYEILTGALPFDGETLHSILYKIAHEPPNLSFEIFADFIDVHALSQVFQTILHKDADARFDLAHDFVMELKSLTAPLAEADIPEETLAKRGGKPSKQRRKAAAGKPKTSDKSASQAKRTSVDPSMMSRPSRKDGESNQEVKEARHQFRMAYETGNISSVRYCLQELRAMGVEVVSEEIMLTRLEEKVAEDEKAQNETKRKQLIKEAREAFRVAMETRNPDSVRYCLKELKKLDVDVTEEKKQLKQLKYDLKSEEEKRREEMKRLQEIEDLRWSFQRRYDKRDLDGCDRVLKRLAELEADTAEEQARYKVLEEKQQSEAKQRTRWTQRTRRQFLNALEEEDEVRCQRLLTELESLLKVDVTHEKAAFEALKQRLAERTAEELRRQRIDELKAEFDQAIKRKDIEACKENLRDLKALRAEVAAETKALARLRKRISGEEELELKEKFINAARDHFRDALTKQNLDGCRYYLRELKQLVNDVGPEERAMIKLEEMLQEADALRLKEQHAQKRRREFKKAFDNRNLENCRYYMRELQQLQVDTTEEREMIAQLENNLEAERELQERMIQQSREKFHEALSQGDTTECEHYLNVLNELGAYITEEQEALAEMKRKDSIDLDAEDTGKMINRMRARFEEAYEAGNKDSCRFYIGELKNLRADVNKESKKLSTFN